VIGGGPAGLEAALTLGRRGLEVTLAEASDGLAGGFCARRPAGAGDLDAGAGLAAAHDLGKLPNVQLFPASRMGAADVAEFGADHVVLATGSHWRRDGVGVIGDGSAYLCRGGDARMTSLQARR
jgi:dimethylamine/trimethylamine dehydrogenase